MADVYYSLTAGGGSGTKTLGGNVTVTNDLTIDTDVTIAMNIHDLTVTDTTDIDGTLADISKRINMAEKTTTNKSQYWNKLLDGIFEKPRIADIVIFTHLHQTPEAVTGHYFTFKSHILCENCIFQCVEITIKTNLYKKAVYRQISI